MSRFIDPTSDFGFKKIFGEEANKDIIMSFINDVLELEAPLRDLDFSTRERLPETAEERKGIYDIFCEDADGNHFLIEMQKNRMAFIKDRMLYYSTFPIVAQAKKGKPYYSYDLPSEDWRIREATAVVYGGKEITPNWDFELKAIYCIAVLGYTLDDSKKAVNRNSLRNDEPPYEPFYGKLKFVTVELPWFDERKSEYSLDFHLNKWLYFLKYLPALESIPEAFKNDPIFRKAFRVAELAKLTPKERREYEINLKYMRDSYAMLTTSYNRGKTEGKIEGKSETLLLLFSQKLGAIPPDMAARLRALNDEDQLDAILQRLTELEDWEALRSYLAAL